MKVWSIKRFSGHHIALHLCYMDHQRWPSDAFTPSLILLQRIHFLRIHSVKPISSSVTVTVASHNHDNSRVYRTSFYLWILINNTASYYITTLYQVAAFSPAINGCLKKKTNYLSILFLFSCSFYISIVNWVAKNAAVYFLFRAYRTCNLAKKLSETYLNPFEKKDILLKRKIPNLVPCKCPYY